MCSKRYSHGSRLMVMSVVLLVLALQPLLAWPFSYGKTAPEGTDYQLQISQDQDQIRDLEDQIRSLESSERALQKESQKQQKMLDTLSSNLQSSGTRIGNTKATAESLLGEIGTLRQISETVDIAYDSLKADYDALKLAYDSAINERDTYFKQATKATEKYNAGNNRVHLSIGTAAIYKPSTNDLGIEGSVGIGYGDVMLNLGAIYDLREDFKFTNISLDNVAYRVGLQIGY